MVWGGIMGNRKTDLVVAQGNINAQRYVADVINAHAFPFIHQHGPGVTLMQDNARPHVARVPLNSCSKTMSTSYHGPRFPIEHIWDQLGRKARANHQIDNVRDLTRALHHE